MKKQVYTIPQVEVTPLTTRLLKDFSEPGGGQSTDPGAMPAPIRYINSGTVSINQL